LSIDELKVCILLFMQIHTGIHTLTCYILKLNLDSYLNTN